MAVCETPDLGRIQAVGLFLLDDCLRPIHGPAAGYIDNCPAAIATSDNVDEGEEFTRRCANGEIKVTIPGVTTLQSIKVDADFHWLDPEWIAQAGGAEPIINDGEVVGWADATSSRFNVLVAVWQEIIGGDACAGDSDEVGSYVRLYPLKGARLTEEGDIGSSKNYTRITGVTSSKHELGAGPIPLAMGVDGLAEWLTGCLPSNSHRFRFQGAQFPDVCGAIDTTDESLVPCVEAS